MYKGKKILAVIPARGGSKGLPGKNIRMLQGKPLVAWTIEHATASNYIDEIFFSTDSPEIAQIAGQSGLKVPGLRPDELAQDNTGTADVITYILENLAAKGKEFDYIVLLEPTSPLRKMDDIDRAIEQLFEHPGADGIVSVGEVHLEHPSIVKKMDEGKLVPFLQSEQKISQRQMLDQVYFPYGVIYMISVPAFKDKKSFYTDNIVPYFIERWQNYEIDDLCDFYCVDAIMNYKKEEKI